MLAFEGLNALFTLSDQAISVRSFTSFRMTVEGMFGFRF